MTSLEGLISPDVSDGGPLMAPDLICNYIDDFTNEAPYSDNSGYCTLHEIAWKNKDRSALFEDVVGSYKSLKIFVKFTDGFQERLLVTPEYKVALSDAKLWFDGQEVPKTTFTQQDSYWMPTKDEDEGEDQQMASDDEDQQMDSDDKRESRHMGTDDGPDWPTSSEAQGAFIVCGIPGIGKSSFLYYVLVERLLANLPTCFQTEPDVFTYWCDKGVFRCKLERTETGFLIPSRVWFLVDSNKKIEEPDTKILNTHARVIQAASPRKNRLDWTRKRSIFTYIWYMKPSPLSELLIMKQFWPRKPSDEQVTKFVANYGPSARLIAGFAHATDEYGEQLQVLLSSLTLKKLRQLLNQLPRLDAADKDIAHWILGVYPGEKRNRKAVGFHTPEIYRLTKTVFGESWDSHARHMFALFNSVGQTRGTAGHLLEDILHRALPTGGYWKVTQLMKGTRKTRTNLNYKTPSSGRPRIAKYLRLGSDTNIVGVKTSTPQPLTTYQYDSDDASISWEKPGYYRPSVSNQATFNSFIVNPTIKCVFALQFTVSKNQKFNKDGSRFLLKRYSGYKLHYILVGTKEDVNLPVPIRYNKDWASLWHMHVRVTDDAEPLSN